jgi:hypothetical protein
MEAATMNDNLKRLHGSLSKKDGFTVPLEQFENDMQDEGNRKRLWENLSKEDGFTVPYGQFQTDIGFSQTVSESQNHTDYGMFDKEIVEKYPQAKQNFDRWQKEQQPENQDSIDKFKKNPRAVMGMPLEEAKATVNATIDTPDVKRTPQFTSTELQQKSNEVNNKIQKVDEYLAQGNQSLGGIFAWGDDILYDRAKTLYSRADRALKASTGEGGTGVGDAMSDMNFWTLGARDLSSMISLKGIANDLEKGKELTPGQVQLLDAWATMQEVGQKAGRGSMPYRVGKNITEMVPWLLQMYGTGGIGSAVKTGFVKSLEKGAAKYLGKRIGTMAAKGAGEVAGAYAQASLMPNTYSDIIQRNLGEATRDKDGNITGFINGEKALKATYKGLTNSMLEVLTERFGEGLSPYANKAMGKLNIGQLGKRVFGDKTNAVFGNFGKIAKAVNWDGAPMEYFEEVINIPLNAMLVGDNKMSDLLDGEQQIETFLTVAAMGSAMAIPNIPYQVRYNKAKNDVKTAEEAASVLIGKENPKYQDNFETIKNAFDSNLPIDNLSKVIDENTRDIQDSDVKASLLNYAKSRTSLSSFEGALQDAEVQPLEPINPEPQTQLTPDPEQAEQAMRLQFAEQMKPVTHESGNLVTAVDDQDRIIYITSGDISDNDGMLKAVFEDGTPVGENGFIHKDNIKDFRTSSLDAAFDIQQQLIAEQAAKAEQEQRNAQSTYVGSEIEFQGQKWTITEDKGDTVTLTSETGQQAEVGKAEFDPNYQPEIAAQEETPVVQENATTDQQQVQQEAPETQQAEQPKQEVLQTAIIGKNNYQFLQDEDGSFSFPVAEGVDAAKMEKDIRATLPKDQQNRIEVTRQEVTVPAAQPWLQPETKMVTTGIRIKPFLPQVETQEQPQADNVIENTAENEVISPVEEGNLSENEEDEGVSGIAGQSQAEAPEIHTEKEIREKIGNQFFSFYENPDGAFVFKPSPEMSNEEALPILEREFENNPDYEVEAKKVLVTDKGATGDPSQGERTVLKDILLRRRGSEQSRLAPKPTRVTSTESFAKNANADPAVVLPGNGSNSPGTRDYALENKHSKGQEGGSIADVYNRIEDKWFGNRDLEAVRANIDTKKYQDRIKGSVNRGVRWQDIDQAIHVYIDMQSNPEAAETHWASLSKEQKRIVDLAGNLTPEQKAIADEIKKKYEQVGQLAYDKGLISNIIENYVSRVWDLSGKQATEFWRKFGTSTRHQKQRILGTIIEGWANGIDLKIKGATNNLEALRVEINNVVENKHLLELGLSLKGADGSPLFTTEHLPGYDEVKHPNFRTWRKVKNTGTDNTNGYRGENFSITPDGSLLIKQRVYAPVKIAKRLNNILGTSVLNEFGAIRWLSKVNAVLKSTMLSWSFFHHMAFMRSYIGGKAYFAKALNPMSAYKDGLESFYAMTPDVEMLIRNGLTVGRIQDWDELFFKQKSRIGRYLDEKKVIPSIRHAIFNLHEQHTSFLFNSFGTGLKVKAALLEYQKMLQAHPEMDHNEIAKMVARLINNDFGGLHLERMGRNKTLQHLLRLTLLAPDWTESNIRTMVNAIAAKGKAERHMNQKFWGRIMLRNAFVSVAVNLLMAMFERDDDKDEDYWDKVIGMYRDSFENPERLHWLDVDISPLYDSLHDNSDKDDQEKVSYYFSTLGHFKDPVKFILYPLRSLKNKGSVITNTAFTVFQGTNWQGKRFTTLPELIGTDDKGLYMTSNKEKGYKVGDPKGGRLKGHLTKWSFGNNGPIQYTEIPSFLLNQLVGWTPVPLQNAIGFSMGDLDAFDALTHGVGFHVGKATTKDKFEEDYESALRDARLYTRMFNKAKKEHDLAAVVELAKDKSHKQYMYILSLEKKIKKLERAQGILEDNGEFENANKLKEKIIFLKKKVVEAQE